MWLFYFNFIWIIVSYLISNYIKNGEKKDKLFLTLSFGYLCFLTMFRSYTVGTDTKTYFAVYREISKTDWRGFWTFINNSGTEPGYLLFCKLLSLLSSNPQILLIISGFLSYYILARFYYKYGEFKFISVLLFFTLGGFDFYASGIRQTLSMSLILIAYDLWTSNKKIPFFAFIILASTIHYSAVLLIPILLVAEIKDDNKFFLWLLTIVIGLTAGFNLILSIILKLFPKYTYYYAGVLFTREPNLAVFLKMTTFLLVLMVAKFIKKTKADQKLNMYKNGYIFERFTAFIPIVYLASFNARAIARLAVMLWPFAFVYYGNKVCEMEIKNRRIIVVLTIILFFLYAYIVTTYKTPEWQSTYPYSFFWQEK